jgi:hypothetical protein
MDNISIRNIIFFTLFIFIAACTMDTLPPAESCLSSSSTTISQKGSILYLGHIYGSDSTVDERIERLNLAEYEHIWLGGDVLGSSDKDINRLEYIDCLFDLKSKGHFWALGNHDISSNNYDWIEQITDRNEFYSEHLNGLTAIILNTTLEEPECNRLKEQCDMFMAVCDTIQASSHLVILSHHIIWDWADGIPSMNQRANANNSAWHCNCEPFSKFIHIMYNKLIEVQERGIQVVFISGDYGQKDKAFQQQCDNDIWFIASGIDANNKYLPDSTKDKVLLLQHDDINRTLDWEFLDLDSLSSL